jgi:hypothetical protein
MQERLTRIGYLGKTDYSGTCREDKEYSWISRRNRVQWDLQERLTRVGYLGDAEYSGTRREN